MIKTRAELLIDPYNQGFIRPKALTMKQKNDLIRSIPDDTYSDLEIKIILYAIKDGLINKKESFPEPKNNLPKVSLEFTKKKKQKVEPELESESEKVSLEFTQNKRQKVEPDSESEIDEELHFYSFIGKIKVYYPTAEEDKKMKEWRSRQTGLD